MTTIPPEHEHPHGSMCPGHVPDDCPKCANAAAAERDRIRQAVSPMLDTARAFAVTDIPELHLGFNAQVEVLVCVLDLLDGDPA